VSPDVLNFLESLKSFDGFIITEDFKVYHRNTFLMSFDSDRSIFLSYRLSCDQSYRNYTPLIEEKIKTNSIGNFSLCNCYSVGGEYIMISEMHYANLLANYDGYRIECKEFPHDLASLYAALGVCHGVKWQITYPLVESILGSR
jgi:hypothetical protein